MVPPDHQTLAPAEAPTPDASSAAGPALAYDVDLPEAGRRAWAALEPMHNVLYFDRGVEEHYRTLGLPGPLTMYFAARSAPLGRVPAAVVSAAFFTFNPRIVSSSLPAAWDQVTPERMLTARAEAADLCLRRLLGAAVDGPEVAEAADLAEAAARRAGAFADGRPLFAAHAALPWPEAPHVRLWHAQTLLREFRGDGHMAVLTSLGLLPVEALLLFVASEGVDGEALRLTRGWPSDVWRSTAADLRRRGLLADGPEPALTDEGVRLRAVIERTTDVRGADAYDVLGVAGALRLATLGTELNRPVVAADVIPWLRKRQTVSRRERVRGRAAAG